VYSLFTKPIGEKASGPTFVDENRAFWQQIQTLAQLHERYQREPRDISSPNFSNGSRKNQPVG